LPLPDLRSGPVLCPAVELKSCQNCPRESLYPLSRLRLGWMLNARGPLFVPRRGSGSYRGQLAHREKIDKPRIKLRIRSCGLGLWRRRQTHLSRAGPGGHIPAMKTVTLNMPDQAGLAVSRVAAGRNPDRRETKPVARLVPPSRAAIDCRVFASWIEFGAASVPGSPRSLLANGG